MNYEEAKEYQLLFGKYAGKTLDKIAKSDDGLKYLDWLTGQYWVKREAQVALNAYLSNPSIAKDLKELLNE